MSNIFKKAKDDIFVKHYLMMLPLALVLAVPLGCGKSKMPSEMPKLYQVAVTVTFDDGKPVDDAVVKFRLTDPVLPRIWLHAGTTDAEGKAKLITDGDFPGIPAGKYSVTIEKYETEAWNGEGVPPPGTVVPRYQLVEDVYLDHATTPLKDVEVKAGKNEIPLSAGKEQRISKPLRTAR